MPRVRFATPPAPGARPGASPTGQPAPAAGRNRPTSALRRSQMDTAALDTQRKELLHNARGGTPQTTNARGSSAGASSASAASRKSSAIASASSGGRAVGLSVVDRASLTDIKAAFRFIDKDDDGSLSRSEFREILQRDNSGVPPLTDKQFRKTMAEIRSKDTDGDGRIDMSEFTSWILRGGVAADRIMRAATDSPAVEDAAYSADGQPAQEPEETVRMKAILLGTKVDPSRVRFLKPGALHSLLVLGNGTGMMKYLKCVLALDSVPDALVDELVEKVIIGPGASWLSALSPIKFQEIVDYSNKQLQRVVDDELIELRQEIVDDPYQRAVLDLGSGLVDTQDSELQHGTGSCSINPDVQYGCGVHRRSWSYRKGGLFTDRQDHPFVRLPCPPEMLMAETDYVEEVLLPIASLVHSLLGSDLRVMFGETASRVKPVKPTEAILRRGRRYSAMDSHNDDAPFCSSNLDVVRASVKFDSAQALMQAYDVLQSRYEVVSVSNSLSADVPSDARVAIRYGAIRVNAVVELDRTYAWLADRLEKRAVKKPVLQKSCSWIRSGVNNTGPEDINYMTQPVRMVVEVMLVLDEVVSVWKRANVLCLFSFCQSASHMQAELRAYKEKRGRVLNALRPLDDDGGGGRPATTTNGGTPPAAVSRLSDPKYRKPSSSSSSSSSSSPSGCSASAGGGGGGHRSSSAGYGGRNGGGSGNGGTGQGHSQIITQQYRVDRASILDQGTEVLASMAAYPMTSVDTDPKALKALRLSHFKAARWDASRGLICRDPAGPGLDTVVRSSAAFVGLGLHHLVDVCKRSFVLVHLNLSHNAIRGHHMVKALCQGLAKAPNLRSLDLGHNGIGPDGMEPLCDYLSAPPASDQRRSSDASGVGGGSVKKSLLTELDLCDNRLMARGARALGVALNSNNTLTSLDMRHNNVSRCGSDMTGVLEIANALEHNVTLKTLLLDGVHEAGKIALGKSMLKNDQSELAFMTCDAFDVSATSQQLNLKHHSLSHADCVLLVGVLQRNHYVVQIDLADNDLGDAGAQAIADLLKVNVTIRQLNIKGNHISDVGKRAIGSTLLATENSLLCFMTCDEWTIDSTQPELRRTKTGYRRELEVEGHGLNTADCILLAGVLKRATSVHSVDAGGNSFGAEGATALGVAVAHSQTLIRLSIPDNDIGPDGATALAKSLKASKKLSNLLVAGNNIGVDGAVALCNALATSKTMKQVSLSENKIGDTGATALANCIRTNQSLKLVSASTNGITHVGCKILADAIKANKSLAAVYIHPMVELLCSGFRTSDAKRKMGECLDQWRFVMEAWSSTEETDHDAASRLGQGFARENGFDSDLQDQRRDLRRDVDRAGHILKSVADDGERISRRADLFPRGRKKEQYQYRAADDGSFVSDMPRSSSSKVGGVKGMSVGAVPTNVPLVRVEGTGYRQGEVHRVCAFTVNIIAPDKAYYVTKRDTLKVYIRGPSSTPLQVGNDVVGSYVVRYKPTTSGLYHIDIRLSGEHIPGSPFPLQCSPGLSHPAHCQATGWAQTFAGSNSSFTVRTRDLFNEDKKAGGEMIEARLRQIDNVGVPVRADTRDNLDGTYTFNYRVPRIGFYDLDVLLRGEHIFRSPFRVQVMAGALHGPLCTLETIAPPGCSTAMAGHDLRLRVQAVDPEGNAHTNGGFAAFFKANGFVEGRVGTADRPVPADIVDNDNGTYDVVLGNNVCAGVWNVNVMAKRVVKHHETGTWAESEEGWVHTAYSPYLQEVEADDIDGRFCTAWGSGLQEAQTDSDGLFVVTGRDSFGNPVSRHYAAGLYAPSVSLLTRAPPCPDDDDDDDDIVAERPGRFGTLHRPPYHAHRSSRPAPAPSNTVKKSTIATDADLSPIVQPGQPVKGFKYSVIDCEDGTHRVLYTCALAGEFDMEVKVGGNHIQGSPFTITLSAGTVDAEETYAEGEGLSTVVCNPAVVAEFTIFACDTFGNKIQMGYERFALTSTFKHAEMAARTAPSPLLRTPAQQTPSPPRGHLSARSERFAKARGSVSDKVRSDAAVSPSRGAGSASRPSPLATSTAASSPLDAHDHEESSQLEFTITDNDVGSYLVKYQPGRAGIYTIAIEHLTSTALSPIRGSPFVVVCESGLVCAANTTVVGSLSQPQFYANLPDGISPCLVRDKMVFTIEARDSFDNRVTHLPVKDVFGKPHKDTFAIKVLGTNGLVAPGGTDYELTPIKTDGEYDGRFEAWVQVNVTGLYDVHVHLSKATVGLEPSSSAFTSGTSHSEAVSETQSSIKGSPFKMKAVHTMDPNKWVEYSGAVSRSKSAQKVHKKVQQLALLSRMGAGGKPGAGSPLAK